MDVEYVDYKLWVERYVDLGISQERSDQLLAGLLGKCVSSQGKLIH